MRTNSTILIGRARAIGLALLAACAIAAPASAQLQVKWHTIDGGGRSVISGGAYSMGGTIGQPDVSRPLNGGAYTMTGGFWSVGLALVAVEDPGDDAALDLPTVFRMYPPAPNPSLRSTTIAFDMPAERGVRLQVHDTAGRLVRTLADATFPAGRHRVTWDGVGNDGHPAAAGIYFVRIEAGASSARHKIALIR
jgi:hypothetical protein